MCFLVVAQTTKIPMFWLDFGAPRVRKHRKYRCCVLGSRKQCKYNVLGVFLHRFKLSFLHLKWKNHGIPLVFRMFTPFVLKFFKHVENIV